MVIRHNSHNLFRAGGFTGEYYEIGEFIANVFNFSPIKYRHGRFYFVKKCLKIVMPIYVYIVRKYAYTGQP